MTEFKESMKSNPKDQKGLELFVNKYSYQSCRTQSQRRQKAFFQRRFHEQAIEILGENFEDIDKEIDFKDNKTNILANEKENLDE